MLLKKLFIAAAMLLPLGTAHAVNSTITGSVGYYFTQDSGTQVYTFINVGPGNAICYYVGNNTAISSIFKTSQSLGKNVTITCDGSGKIVQVAN
jgi:hypothetical protein